SETRLCVFPAPAPAWMTALAGGSTSSDTGHLAAVLVGVGGQGDQPARRLQLAVVAGERPDRERARAHLADALLDGSGERQRLEVDPALAQRPRPLGVAERKVSGVDPRPGFLPAQHLRIERKLELGREQRFLLQL